VREISETPIGKKLAEERIEQGDVAVRQKSKLHLREKQKKTLVEYSPPAESFTFRIEPTGGKHSTSQNGFLKTCVTHGFYFEDLD
jgi:hypothetical protein